MREPPKGFRGVFLWTLGSAELAAGVRIPSDRVAAAVAVICASDASGHAPLAGIVVLGRWLGAKPGDLALGVHEVETRSAGFRVRLDGGVVLEVQGQSGAVLTPGPYGDLLVIQAAREVVVTDDGEQPDWLPSVRDSVAYDMRGQSSRWPRRKVDHRRSPFAPTEAVPGLMLSVWHARPLPQEVSGQPG